VLDDAVAVFARNATTGALAFVEAVRDDAPGVDGLDGAFGLTMSPDGRHLYATGQIADAVAVFAVAPFAPRGFAQEGVDGVDDALDRPLDVAISPDGRHAYVASFASDAVAIFAIDAAQDQLHFLGRKKQGEIEPANALSIDGLNGARAVLVSPDGRQLYATGAASDAVVWFDREPTDGSLVFRAAYVDAVAYDNAWQLAWNADASQLLLAALDANQYVRFDRAADGGLSFASASPTGLLTGPRSIGVSSDDATLFVASLDPSGATTQVAAVDSASDTVADVVSTGAATTPGTLRSAVRTRDDRHVYAQDFDEIFAWTWDTAAMHFDPPAPIDTESLLDRGVDTARNLVLSTDDRYLLAPGQSGGFALFARDVETGELYLAQTELQGVQGIDGLTGARDAAFTPRGRHLLVVGDAAAGTVALFVPEPRAGTLGLGALLALGLVGSRATGRVSQIRH
jgi:6-phosphogluconolactonase (cycloisomerase 2 family)